MHKQAKELPWLKNVLEGVGHMKSETGAISSATKWTLVQQKFKKKKKFDVNNFLSSLKEDFHWR